MTSLPKGAFVRVKNSSDFRPGQDGMVVSPSTGDETVGLLFGTDRYNQSPADLGIVRTGLIEEWHLGELDLTSLEV